MFQTFSPERLKILISAIQYKIFLFVQKKIVYIFCPLFLKAIYFEMKLFKKCWIENLINILLEPFCWIISFFARIFIYEFKIEWSKVEFSLIKKYEDKMFE